MKNVKVIATVSGLIIVIGTIAFLAIKYFDVLSKIFGTGVDKSKDVVSSIKDGFTKIKPSRFSDACSSDDTFADTFADIQEI